MTVTDQIDEALAPLIIKLNKLRQARDSINLTVLALVPYPLKVAMDEVFAFVEVYERARGIELQLRTPAPADQDSQNAEKGDDGQSHGSN